MTNPEDVDPDTLILVSTGCWQCGTHCPWTDETEPTLTRELADLWFEAHREICTVEDWPGAEITWEQPA